ncbi:MAG: hypothetical protein MJ142_08050 [Clostridia bacterium]|nr:hypothetical protein [Clostridia bacterium]
MKKAGVSLGFIGAVLLICAAIGFRLETDPGFLQRKYYYDFTLEQFLGVCRSGAFWFAVFGAVLLLVGIGLGIADNIRNKGAEKHAPHN